MYPGHQLPPLIRQSLIVRIVDRIQDLSIKKCSGCKMEFRFGGLHPCQKNSITDRTELFLPQVLTEVLERIERLLDLHQAQYKFPVMNMVDFAREYVQQLTPKQLYDRQYINEDTGDMVPYNNSWIVEETEIIQDLREPILQQATVEVQTDEMMEEFPPHQDHELTDLTCLFGSSNEDAKLSVNVKKNIKRKAKKVELTPVDESIQNQLLQACQEIEEEEQASVPKIKRRKLVLQNTNINKPKKRFRPDSDY